MLNKNTKRFLALSIWLGFTASLAGWLYLFTLKQIENAQKLLPINSDEFMKYHSMLFWEALTLLLCLIGGAVAIAYFIYRDTKQTNSIRNFFLALSHELKTSIASLNLQIDSLTDADNLQSEDTLKFLKKDLNRLTLQLENSLFLAEAGQRQLLLQSVNLNELLDHLKYSLPDLEIIKPSSAVILKADVRAIQSILLNIGYNAIKHGKAKLLKVSAKKLGNLWQIDFEDDGLGYKDDRNKLGRFLTRPNSKSGSGLGLYLAKTLANSLKGSLSFPETNNGFLITLKLPAI
jgi:signal transduction histidine kinase